MLNCRPASVWTPEWSEGTGAPPLAERSAMDPAALFGNANARRLLFGKS